MPAGHRVAVVTGANKGIGKEIARKLGSVPNLTTILACRNKALGAAAVKELQAAGGCFCFCKSSYRYIYVNTHTLTYTYICIYTSTSTYMCVCIYILIYICIHMYVHMCKHMFIYVRMYTCMHVWTTRLNFDASS